MSDESSSTTPSSTPSKAPQSGSGGNSKGKRPAATQASVGAAAGTSVDIPEGSPDQSPPEPLRPLQMLQALQARIDELEERTGGGSSRITPATASSRKSIARQVHDGGAAGSSDAPEAQVQELKRSLAQMIEAIDKTTTPAEGSAPKRPCKGDS